MVGFRVLKTIKQCLENRESRYEEKSRRTLSDELPFSLKTTYAFKMNENGNIQAYFVRMCCTTQG